MKDKYGDVARLEHILKAISEINSFVDLNDRESFLTNKVIVSAVMYQFVIIGEACKHISDEVKTKYPHIEWRLAYITRNILVHEYPMVQLEIIFKTIHHKLPALEENIKKVLEEVRLENPNQPN